MTFRKIMLSAFSLCLATCLTAAQAEPYLQLMHAMPSSPVLIVNATILTGTGERIENGSLLISDGRIEQIGDGTGSFDAGAAKVIDAAGPLGHAGHDRCALTPRCLRQPGNRGAFGWQRGDCAGHGEGVGRTQCLAPGSGVQPRPREGGVTAMQVLPGSANLIGGRSVTLKNVPSITYQGMKFPAAPHGLKMACGENPKRVYGERDQTPSTRMGNFAGYRAQWIEAQRYIQDWEEFEKNKDGRKSSKEDDADPPKRDLRLETLAAVLKGEILVHMHCYRADEMMTVMDMADEFGYRVSAFHHGVEAYKIADELAENGVCGALWADWWGFKAEAYDGIQENIAIVDRPEGGCAIVHSDSEEGIQRLNQEAAKAMTRGRLSGLDITPESAIRWITANPAKAMGILDQTGTLEPGKMADVVIWNGNPFSVYAKADQVFVDGALLYDRNDPALQPVSDFELGQQLGAEK